MKYLILWSGHIRGARKAVIDSEPAHLVGHYVDGVPVTFSGLQFRLNCVAPQHRAAWDSGRVQAWLTGDAPDSPWAIRVYNTHMKQVALYYAQPLTKESE